MLAKLQLSIEHAKWLEAVRKIPCEMAAEMGVVSRGENLAFEFDDKAIVPSIKKDTLDDVPTVLKPIAKVTSLYARSVTQFMPLFAPVNTIRDVWEKSEIIRTRKLVDQNGNAINANQTARRAIVYSLDPSTWAAT